MKKLKRFSIFILISLLLFSLFFPACGKDNQNGNTNDTPIDIEEEAKLCYLEKYLLNEHSEATIEDVSFFNYIGTYGNCLVAVFYGGKWHTWNGDFPDIAINFTINNLTFEYPMGYPILVYCDQQIYTLQEAYGSELISAETLAQIHTDYYTYP